MALHEVTLRLTLKTALQGEIERAQKKLESINTTEREADVARGSIITARRILSLPEMSE